MEEKPVRADAVVRIQSIDFEVPQKYINQRILIKYNPTDLSCIYVYDSNSKTMEKALPADKKANAKIKRKPISYD